MKKTIITSALILANWGLPLLAQNMGQPRTNDLRLRWNIGQFANIGRYALQFGLEKDIAPNKTLGGELGLSFFRGDNSIIYQRYNYKGVQGNLEYRNYFKGFHVSKVKPFMSIAVFARQLNFDADVTLGYGVTSSRDWDLATHFEQAVANYKTSTLRVQGTVGFRLPISPMMYFEASAGPAFGYYNVDHGLTRNQVFVVDNFSNPFFMSAQKGSYFSPALYGSVSFGFVISKGKTPTTVH